MSTEIALHEDNLPAQAPAPNLIQAALADMQAAAQLAETLCRTSFVPKEFKGKPEEGTVAILYGQTIGMDPATALQQVFVIGGKPALYARAMASIVLNAGHELWTEEASAERVVVCGRRAGTDRVERSEWDYDRAKKAGYTSNPLYTKDPEAMLYARALATVARRVAPDALLGMAYNAEELQLADIGPDGTPRITKATAERIRPRTIIEAAAAVTPAAEGPRAVEAKAPAAKRGKAKAEAVGEPADPAPAADLDNLLSAIEATDNADALREIWRTANSLPADQCATVRQLAEARIEDLAALRAEHATTKES